MQATIDGRGRLVLPKAVRDAAHLHPGTRVQFQVRGDRVEIEPVPMEVRFERSGPLIVAVAQTQSAVVTTAEIEHILAETRAERLSDRSSE